MPTLFPLSEYWWLYGAFTGGVLLLLALDLGIFHRHAREVSFREAIAWSAIWVCLALLFSVALYAYALRTLPSDVRLTAVPGFDSNAAAWQLMLEFLTGYVVEYSLSVDNIFVFLLVLSYFNVPPQDQHRVLFYGILGALIFRAIFITLGSVLMQFHWIVWVFGLFLIVTGIRMVFATGEALEPGRNPVIRVVRRILRVTPTLHGHRFFVREHGRISATPLLVALLCLEASDIVFAVDSVPAIFALTREPFVVFTSNIFAILGLRSMYFMLGGAVGKFRLLHYGLAAVLVFVGLKMVWIDGWYGGRMPITTSLAIIATLIGGSVVLSFIFPASRAQQTTSASFGDARAASGRAGTSGQPRPARHNSKL